MTAVGLKKALLRARLRMALARTREAGDFRSAEPGRPRIFVMLAADYGNLGDLAITRAQIGFLRVNFGDQFVVDEIPISRTLCAIKRLRKDIGPDDVITLIGGGNTGDMYDDIQFLRELVIRSFPKHRIISFPQTIEFTDSSYGRWAARRARKLYNSHHRLTVIARDSRSLAIASRMFDNVDLQLAPDVVLTRDESDPHTHREGIVLAFRSDLEQALTEERKRQVVELLRARGHLREIDTHIGNVRLSRMDADARLEATWEEWRSAQLVVTDRLHGMIFAIITGTPCLVFDSATGKTGQFYRDWLSALPFVELTESNDVQVLGELIDRLGAMEVDGYPSERFKKLLGQAIDLHHG